MITKKNGTVTGVEVWDGDSLIFELDSNLTYTNGYIYSPGGEKVAEEDYTISSPVNPSDPALFFYINDLARTPVQITDELNNVVNEAITGPYGNLTFSRGTISSSTMPNPILVNHIDYNTTQTDPTPFSSNGESRMSYGFSVPAELRDKWDARPLRKEVRDNKRRLTQHSHEDDLGLIYMQARWYDPLTGMFLSEDPAGQFLNPYVYNNNNPVAYMDPDGEFAFVPLLIAAAQGAAISSGISVAAQLAINGEINMGSVLKAGLTGALSGGMSFGIGEMGEALKLGENLAFKTATHGISGGIQSAIDGGNFFSGLAAGAVGNVGGHYMGTNIVRRTVVAGLTSGATSAITGGNFWVGARAGAFNQLFNFGKHELLKKGGYLIDKFDEWGTALDASGIPMVMAFGTALRTPKAVIRASKFAMRQYRTNKKFRRFFHKVFKPKQVTQGGKTKNRDATDLEMLEAWEQFNEQ